MILLLIPYLLIGLVIARASATYFNSKNELDWTRNITTILFVLLIPFIWPTMPLLILGKYVAIKAAEGADWAGRELANPKENV